MIHLEPHQYAEIFPMLGDQAPETINFIDSIEREGIKVPIVLYHGKILDGRNRYRAYLSNPDKIELRTEDFEGTDEEALRYVIALNNDRRHLNTSQRALAGWKYSRLESKLNIPVAEMKRWVQESFLVSKDSLEQIGAIFNDHKYTLDEKKCLIDGISAGMAIDFAHRLLKKAPKESWKDAVDGMLGGGPKSDEVKDVNKLIKSLKRRDIEEKFGNATRAEANKAAEEGKGLLYGVIYTDPPWKFEVRSENGMDRSPENHYPTMTLEDIRGMKIPAAKDCALFMWVTVPHLANGVEILESWGFDYKSAYFWHKTKPGLGYWSANTMEVLLLGTKGEVPAPLPDQRMEQVIRAEQGKHSEKPEVFADGITKMFPNVPKLEMFSRGVKHKGDHWFYHGNESEGRIEPTEPETKEEKPKRNGGGRKSKAKEAVSEETEGAPA